MFKVLAAIIVVAAMSAPAEAGIFVKGRGHARQIRITKYPRFWSPGIMLPYLTQGRGGPRMIYRGDWVPAYMVK